MGKIVRAGAGAGIFDKLELEPDKNGPVPQHCQNEQKTTGTNTRTQNFFLRTPALINKLL
jgi:hypothetical protein